MHRDPYITLAGDLAQEYRLAGIGLKQMHVRDSEHRQHQPREPGAAAKIDQHPSRLGNEWPELPTIEKVAPPRIGQGRVSNQIDPRLPAPQQSEMNRQPIECFT